MAQRHKNAAERSALETNMNTNQRAHTEIGMRGKRGLVDPIASGKPIVDGGAVAFSSTSKIESGAIGRRCNRAGKHIGGARIINHTNPKPKMRRSDNRAEARGRALGRERTAMGATDNVV